MRRSYITFISSFVFGILTQNDLVEVMAQFDLLEETRWQK